MSKGDDNNTSLNPGLNVAFIGSECYPFVKTGGLGDVMYALPKALVRRGVSVRVLLPKYRCIPAEYHHKMIYRGHFMMDLCSDGRSFYVGIMEYIWDGVIYDFIDNEEFFSYGNPYTEPWNDIARYCYFSKASLAALNYMECRPDIIHCHDWQTGLVPLYLKTLFKDTEVAGAKVVYTIHNLRFQGVSTIPHMKYWSNLPGELFDYYVLKQREDDANMLKGAVALSDMVTTVSPTYAMEIQESFYGDGLDPHLRYHKGKLKGVINGIDYDIWDPSKDSYISADYDAENVIAQKKLNKQALQEKAGLNADGHMFVIGVVSRLTDQKGFDLVNSILPNLIDGHTQLVVLGTGERYYEDLFRNFEAENKGVVCSMITYDEETAHQIYAGADALLIPSMFEPCGLTQLISMHYGTIPIVRETGGLKDTVEPYNKYTNQGNGFSFDRYDPQLLLGAVINAKTLYFTDRERWDEMVVRDMNKDVSWDSSALKYIDFYKSLL